MSKPKHPPTAEQRECIDAFATGFDLRINAYAGTGKTTTLRHLGYATGKHGTYLAFNKAIADEASKLFPRHVRCSTTHSLAFRDIIGRYDDSKKLTGSVNGGYLAAKLGFKDTLLSPTCKMTAKGRGFLICETLKSWQRSGARELHTRNVPLAGALKGLPDDAVDALKATIVRDAREVWDMMTSAKSTLPLGFDGFLKLYAMGNPVIPGDFILLDEAQDTNGVVMQMMREQDAQLICVGDRHQQIYEWRGARNAMVELPAELEKRLSTSFRFGPNAASFATRILTLLGESVPLSGNASKIDRIGPVDQPRAIICRTNARLLEELLAALDAGGKPHIVGGTGEVRAWLDAAESLQAGYPVEHPIEFFGFAKWDDVRTASESDEGQDLRRIVKTVDKYGVSGLRNALAGAASDEASASVVLSTGHKSKGREWDSVRLCDDFLMGLQETDKQPANGAAVTDPSPELRLFYVAATRCETALDVPAGLLAKLQNLEGKRAFAPAA